MSAFSSDFLWYQSLREHPYRALWEQSGCKEQASESQAGDIPQEEEPAIL